MHKALRKRHWRASYHWHEATASEREEFSLWEEIQDAAYEQVKRFYELMGSYPVTGDELHISGSRPGTAYPGLRVTRRILYTGFETTVSQLIYEVEGEKDFLEELEEYQEGDLVEDED